MSKQFVKAFGTVMRRLCAIMLVVLGGCLGDAALPIVSSTRIPQTQLEVHLGGPDKKGHFGYYVTSSNGIHYGFRELGRLKANQIEPSNLESLGDGVIRIQWGDGATAQFAIIDTTKKQFVEDSNEENPRNQPFTDR